MKKKKTDYEFVGENIYQTGTSYRVRIRIDGTQHSQNFNSKKAAIRWRNEMKRKAAYG